ncbi:hypothetical protein EYF80_017052 [Liparis tanakae]|uniref:Uncharacterized protein n=1 Tax=Liparis tanakae TaxID=230148 RepID=A0A4Z2I481_9TELE|nr:hypothetical protein EYF80_017052 [Liparis tanakae]
MLEGVRLSGPGRNLKPSPQFAHNVPQWKDYLLGYQIPSECEVKQTASLTHAACHHLRAAS